MKQLLRIITIIRVIAKYRLDTFIDAKNARWPLKLIVGFFSFFPNNPQLRGERLRQALEDLGPVFVKFGQLLSTRRDLLPPDLADELALLQDQVPPFDNGTAVAIIESALGKPVNQAFAAFDPNPLASASVAQVHAARLHAINEETGREVVVKVIRPNIESVIDRDLGLLTLLAQLLEKLSSNGRRLHPVTVVEDYRQTIFDELNLRLEAANCAQLRRNFADSETHRLLLNVPQVIWDLSDENVLVMERIYGVPVSDIDELKRRNTNLKLLAERGVEIFFTQVFEHNFFHADMHPGNIFVDTSDPDSPSYIGIDCAIMGSLSDSDRYYLARNMLAMFNRDYATVARLHIESGWVPSGTNAHAFETVMRSALEPIFDKPLAEISFGTLLIYLFQAAQRFGMEVQPSLVLLQKTLLNIEGLGRQLYPELDLWQTAKPFLEDWMAERYSPRRMVQEFEKRAPALLEALPELPDLILNRLRDESAQQRGKGDQWDSLQKELISLKRAQQRGQVINITLLLIAVLLVYSAF